MSRYSVDTDALRNAASRCEDIGSNLGSLTQQIRNVRLNLSFDMGRYSGVLYSLNTCMTNGDRCRAKVKTLGSTGVNIANKYAETEEKVVNNTRAASNIIGEAGWQNKTGNNNANNTSTNNSKQSDGIWKIVKKLGKGALDVVGKFGVFGKIGSLPLALLKSLIDGDGFGTKDVGSAIKGIGNTILGGIDLYGKTKGHLPLTSDMIRELAGLNKYKHLSMASTKAGWLAKLENAKTTAGNVIKDELTPSKMHIAGWALALIANGFNNYDEYKTNKGTANEISKGRAVAETVSETLLDIGKGVAITAGIAAGAAAIGVSAPAVVVAGLGVAVSTVADIVCESITGKGVTEVVSDAILDTAGKAAKTVSDVATVAVKKVGSAAKTVANAASGWFNKVISGPKALFAW